MHVRFPPSCSSSVELPFARIKGSVAFPRGFPRRFPTTLSHQVFPRGFPTVVSHVPPWCQSILVLKVESVPEPEDSSPVLTWILGYFRVSPGGQSSSQVVACTCAFLPSCSSSVTLPFARIKGSGAFPRGFPSRLSHEAFPQDCSTCHHGVSRSSA